jgi:hypothetical protein
VNVDTQNIVNQLVLAEIDVHGGYGDQECLEYGSSTCVIASQKSLGGQSQMFTHVNDARSFADAAQQVDHYSVPWDASSSRASCTSALGIESYLASEPDLASSVRVGWMPRAAP